MHSCSDKNVPMKSQSTKSSNEKIKTTSKKKCPNNHFPRFTYSNGRNLGSSWLHSKCVFWSVIIFNKIIRMNNCVFTVLPLASWWRREGICYLQFTPCPQAYILETMFCASTIGCAIDFTFQFNWLRDGYTLDHNSTDIRFSDQVNMTYLTAGQLGWVGNLFCSAIFI